MSLNPDFPAFFFLHVIIPALTVRHALSHDTVMFSEVNTCVVLWCSCYVLTIWLLLSSPLLTFDLSDLETSVDSRCTTDSADSAFIGRRYWFLASFLPFLSSSHPLPSPSIQEVRSQIRLQHKKRKIPLFSIGIFLTDYYIVCVKLSFLFGLLSVCSHLHQLFFHCFLCLSV